jgi:Uncharacterized protein family, UPF0114
MSKQTLGRCTVAGSCICAKGVLGSAALDTAATALSDVIGSYVSRWGRMEKLLSWVGSLLYGMRFTMLFFYVGLVTIILGILGKFVLETYRLMNTLLFDEISKIDLIIKVLELVDMTMVAQLVWVTRAT